VGRAHVKRHCDGREEVGGLRSTRTAAPTTVSNSPSAPERKTPVYSARRSLRGVYISVER